MNTIELNQKLEAMLIGAERYAFGRRTYIVGETVDYLIALMPKLSDWCLTIMSNDMWSNRNVATGYGSHDLDEKIYGDNCDFHDWLRFESALQKEMDKRGIK